MASSTLRRSQLRLVQGSRSGDKTWTDEAIIEAIERGDRSAASALYDRLAGVVDRTLTRLFGRRESDHEDLMQTSFEQIVRTLAQRKFARACSLPTWAAAITSHVGMNALRSRRRERAVLDRGAEPDEERHAGGDLEQEVRVREEIERVRRHLAALKPEKAEALFLHDVLGHDLAEIAVITGTTVAAAQSRLVRARRELLDRLERER